MKGANTRGVGANDVFTALALPAGSVELFLGVIKPVGAKVSSEPNLTDAALVTNVRYAESV